MFSQKTKGYSFKIAFVNFSVFLVGILVFSTLFISITAYQNERLLVESNRQILNQLNTFSDKYILEKLNFLCNEYFTKPSKDAYINRFYENFLDSSHEEFEQLSDYIGNILQQNSFLQSIYLYNGRFDTVLGANRKIVYGISDYREEFEVANYLFSYLQNIKSDFWIAPVNNTYFKDKADTLTLVHYVAVDETWAFKNYVDCVIINIDTRNIIRFFDDLDTSNTQYFMIMGGDGKILAKSLKGDRFSQQSGTEYPMSKMLSTTSGIEKTGMFGRKQYVTWLKSTLNDWRYVYVFSPSSPYANLPFMTLVIAGLAIVFIYLGYFLINHFTRKLYLPIEQAILNVRAMRNGAYSQDDAELLQNFLSDLALTDQNYKNINERYNALIIERTLSDLINGLIQDESTEIRTRFLKMGIDFSHCKYRLAIVELNAAILSTLPLDQRESVIFSVIDKISKHINCSFVRVSAYNICVILNYDTLNLTQLFETFKNIFRERGFANVYYTGEIENLSDISTLYLSAADACKYSYIYGFDNILSAEELAAQDADQTTVDLHSMQALERYIVSGNKEQFVSECNATFSAVRRMRHSFRYAQELVAQVFSIICRVAREQTIPIDKEESFHQILKNRSFDDCSAFIFELADGFFHNYEDRGKYKSEMLSREIVKYISENAANDLSLTAVAEHFQISAGYLSKFFKENLGMGFSKYVADKKFSAAAEMLTSEPSVPVEQIAARLGYFDLPYFGRIFKARYGMTPLQYRKAKATPPDPKM